MSRDILGDDNPIISSLDVTETSEHKLDVCSSRDQTNNDDSSLLVGEGTTQVNITKPNESATSLFDSAKVTSSNRPKKVGSCKSKRTITSADKTECMLNELKTKKMLQQIEILQKESYLKSLEILKLERELAFLLTYIIDVQEANLPKICKFCNKTIIWSRQQSFD